MICRIQFRGIFRLSIKVPVFLLSGGCLFLLVSHQVMAANVRVSLFTGRSFSSVTICHISGKYAVKAGSVEILTLSSGDTVTLQMADDQMLLVAKDQMVAFSDQFSFEGSGLDNILAISAGDQPFRQYDDNLKLEASRTGISCFLTVDLEKYVAGVVQAEAGGSSNHPEFFKVQAIVSRTYALRMMIAYGDSMIFTDNVTNQVYKGRYEKHVIREAVEQTKGLAIVYDDTLPINAVFHSNSGGYTLSSADVWVTSLPYLQPVADTFSLSGKNYQWTASIPVVQWLNYLNATYGYPVHIDSMRNLALNFSQTERVRTFHKDILLTSIRNDLKLKSTWFSVTSERDSVIFRGRGYGHGVGLSQEGAIRMADLGYSSDEIIRFYYTGVSLRSYSDWIARH